MDKKNNQNELEQVIDKWIDYKFLDDQKSYWFPKEMRGDLIIDLANKIRQRKQLRDDNTFILLPREQITKALQFAIDNLQEQPKEEELEILYYKLSNDKVGLLAHYKNGGFYHIHSDELSSLEKWIHKILLNQTHKGE